MPQNCCSGAGGAGGIDRDGFMELLREVTQNSCGLQVTGDTLDVHIANVEPQYLRCENGLIVDEADRPDVPCRLLNEDDIIAWRGGGQWAYPSGSPQALQAAITNGWAVSSFCFGTTDNIAMWGVEDPLHNMTLYTIPGQGPATPMNQLSYSELTAWQMDAGTTDNLTRRTECATNARRTPNGGFFGWSRPRYTMMTLEEVLNVIQCRQPVVTFWTQFREQDQQALLSVIANTRYKGSLYVVTRPFTAQMNFLDQINTLGVKTGVDLRDYTDITIARMQQAGAEFATWSNGQQPPARHDEIIDAGINWISSDWPRHAYMSDAKERRAWAFLSYEPAWAKRWPGLAGQYQGTQSLTWNDRSLNIGQISNRIEMGTTRCRGYSHASTSVGPGVAAYLQGSASTAPWAQWESIVGDTNIGDGTDFHLRVSMKFTNAASGHAPKAGFRFGGITDAPSRTYDNEVIPGTTGYYVLLRAGTTESGFMLVWKLNPDGSRPILVNEFTGNTWASGSIPQIGVRVTPSNFTVYRFIGGSISYQRTVNDGDFRGPYIHSYAELTTQDYEFAWSNFNTSSFTTNGVFALSEFNGSGEPGDDGSIDDGPKPHPELAPAQDKIEQ